MAYHKENFIVSLYVYKSAKNNVCKNLSKIMCLIRSSIYLHMNIACTAAAGCLFACAQVCFGENVSKVYKVCVFGARRSQVERKVLSVDRMIYDPENAAQSMSRRRRSHDIENSEVTHR